ncbi:MAG: prolipoprotein diacylglyceryl transferase [Bacillales bacterium]|nr:prolipoprotein diacylglyceryl transferase [Bacillales bacterium]
MFNFLTDSSCCGTIPDNWFTNWFYDPDFIGNITKYSICILTGIIIAFFVCTIEAKRMNMKRDDILDCAIIIVPLAILGARIWYLSFDGTATFQTYLADYGFFKAIFYTSMYAIGFTSVPYLWHFNGLSGLAIHGAILVAFVGSIICVHIKKWKTRRMLDIVAPGLLIGQIAGRWGNFFNQEAHGTVIGGFNATDLANGILTPNLTIAEQYDMLINTYHIPKWIANNMCMYNESYDFGTYTSYVSGWNYYHPTFLYESLWNLLGLALYFVFRRTKFVKSGAFGALYLIWYGIGRFFIEAIRMDSLYTNFFNLKTAQVTSIIMIAIGIFALIYIRFIKKGESYKEAISSASSNIEVEDAPKEEPKTEETKEVIKDKSKEVQEEKQEKKK